MTNLASDAFLFAFGCLMLLWPLQTSLPAMLAGTWNMRATPDMPEPPIATKWTGPSSSAGGTAAVKSKRGVLTPSLPVRPSAG